MQVDVQLALEGTAHQDVPDTQLIQRWVDAAIQGAEIQQAATLVTVRIVEEDEITQLNENYRQKTGPTNVLSFPFELPPGMPAELAATELSDSELGDVVVCAPVVEREASEQGKSAVAHWAHMVIHGTLHLLGYDHVQDSDAQKMESLEIAVLETLGYANPYS